MPSEYKSVKPIETTTILPLVIDGPSPNLTYQFANGTLQILGNLTNPNNNVEIQTSTTISLPLLRTCRNKAKNCEEMQTMCGNRLYEAFLTDMCASTCGKCGLCVDQSRKLVTLVKFYKNLTTH